MRRFLAILLATAMLCVGMTAFASEENETVSDSASGMVFSSASADARSNRWDGWSGWGRWTPKEEQNSNIPWGTAAFFLQLDGLQMDTNGNIAGRPVTAYTDVVATAELVNPYRNKSYAIATGNGVTEKDILAEVKNPPEDDAAFDAARGQLMHRGYIRSDKGEVIPWAKLNSKYYAIDWYVFKCESDGWHIDGRILDLATKDIIDIVIPDDPKDIPKEAYEEVDPKEEEKDIDDDKDDDKDDDDEEITEDTSIDLSGATFAYIFGYEPVINTITDEEGNVVKHTARVYMGMDDSVTVEQVCAMLTRLLDQEGYTKDLALKVTPSVEPYRGTWFARGLAYQCSVGGLNSEGGLPLGDVSRGLVAKLVSRALKLSMSKKTPFSDVSGSPYEEDIRKVYAYGYMNGVSKSEFAPDDVMTRAEFCQLFNNIIGRNKMGLTAIDEDGKKHKITPEDYSIVDMSPDHWAYKVCLKATSAYDDDGYVSISKRQENIRNKLDDYNSQLLY